MPAETTARRWSIASWLVAHGRSDLGRVTAALRSLDVDVIALQSLEESDVEHVADELDMGHAWELSYHPTSRLIPGSGIGLAVLTHHTIASSMSVVVNEHRSAWSKQRRIAQFSVVNRADQTGYAIGHAVGNVAAGAMPRTPAPLVMLRPEQVGYDPSEAIALPDGATVVETNVSNPIETAEPLLTVTFEMPWVRGDFPVV